MPIQTLKVLTDIYKTNAKGQQKLIRRNVEYKKMFETNGLLVEHYLNSKGVPSKKWCMVKEPNGDNSYYRLNHKFEEIEKLIKPVYIYGLRRW